MGIEQTPLRIPAEWDPEWFESFVRDVLSLMDVRNGTGGDGIAISGSASEKVTISVSPISAIALLGQTISNPPTQAQVQAIDNKVDEIINGLGLDA